MTIEEWAKDFRSYVNALDMPRDDYKGIMEYIDDALSFLKEQKAVKPIFASDEMGCMTYYVCPACKIAIDYGDKFCRHCGRKMIWEENT